MSEVKDGRKIHRSMENPFDNIFIDAAHWLNIHVFRPLSFTPNMLTTLSLLFGLTSAFLFHMSLYNAAIVCFLVAYLFDCADGNFARMYDQVTTFGDYYDHIADLCKAIILVAVIVFHNIPWQTKVVMMLGHFILFMLCLVHFGCQERLYNTMDTKDSLSFTKPLCKDARMIYRTRYVGCGTGIVYIVLCMFYISSLKSTSK